MRSLARSSNPSSFLVSVEILVVVFVGDSVVVVVVVVPLPKKNASKVAMTTRRGMRNFILMLL